MSDSSHSQMPRTASVLTHSMPIVTAPVHEIIADQQSGVARQTVRVKGVVAEVGLPAAGDHAQFTALLMVSDPQDITAPARAVRLVWQGQRAVPGVSVGTTLDCVGVLCHRDEHPTIFNPRYEIMAKKVQR
ncbi:MAG: hypothetical protein Q4C81_06580 [Kocuria sp.]|nr:hypothetical protein [Kocuria sp.]